MMKYQRTHPTMDVSVFFVSHPHFLDKILLRNRCYAFSMWHFVSLQQLNN